MKLPRFIKKLIPGYEVTDLKEWIKNGFIEVYLKPLSDEMNCNRCESTLSSFHGSYNITLQHLPLFNFKTYLRLKRRKGYCSTCKKIRSEKLDFVAPETPHYTTEYSWWLGRLCEFSTITKAAKFTQTNEMTLWRMDFERMRRMFQHYEIPKVTKISVDEVYAQKYRKGFRNQGRDKSFFTIICDLDSRRVIWVSESRSQSALDEFYKVIGPERCDQIEVVVGDQHDAYKASTEEFCKNAVFVWDRFHLVQTMEMAVDETRKELHSELRDLETKRLTRGKWKYIFLQKNERRSLKDREHLEEVFRRNEKFAKLDMIKERFLTFFDAKDAYEGDAILADIGIWLNQSSFTTMRKWFDNLMKGWKTLKNWFKFRVTSSLSEGQNNVIKTLKKKAYGYRNMAYFKLKILQVCGFLNSNYISMDFQRVQQM
jgi:transposase